MHLLPAPYLQEPWLKQTTAIHTEKFLIFQDTTNDISAIKFYSLLDAFVFEREIIFAGLITFFFLLVSFFIGKRCSDKNFRLAQFKMNAKYLYAFVRKVFGRDLNLSSRKGFFEVYYTLLFGLQSGALIMLLNNNIRTNKLVVDSSGVIKDKVDIFTTNRTACYVEGDIEHTLALTSPNDSLLTRIYNEKNKLTKPIKGLRNKRIKDRCIIEKTLDNSNFHVEDAFGVLGEQMAYILLRALSDVKSKDILWIGQNEVYSLNYHIYHLNGPQYDHYDKMSAFSVTFLASKFRMMSH